MNNLRLVSEDVRAIVQDYLSDPKISDFTKRIVTEGLEQDPTEAYNNVEMAKVLLSIVRDSCLS